MTDPNDKKIAGENIKKVVETAAKVDIHSPKAQSNELGMENAYGNFIKYNDNTLPDRF